jgi:hypothetical protein
MERGDAESTRGQVRAGLGGYLGLTAGARSPDFTRYLIGGLSLPWLGFGEL